MLEDALAHVVREVEPRLVVALLQTVDDAHRLVVVLEASGLGMALAQQAVEDVLARMPEGRVAEIVADRDRLRQILVQAQGPGHAAGDLRDLDRVRQPRPEMVALVGNEDLGLVLEAAKRPRVDDPVPVPGVVRAGVAGRGGHGPPRALGPDALRGEHGEALLLEPLEVLAREGSGGGGHPFSTKRPERSAARLADQVKRAGHDYRFGRRVPEELARARMRGSAPDAASGRLAEKRRASSSGVAARGDAGGNEADAPDARAQHGGHRLHVLVGHRAEDEVGARTARAREEAGQRLRRRRALWQPSMKHRSLPADARNARAGPASARRRRRDEPRGLTCFDRRAPQLRGAHGRGRRSRPGARRERRRELVDPQRRREPKAGALVDVELDRRLSSAISWRTAPTRSAASRNTRRIAGSGLATSAGRSRRKMPAFSAAMASAVGPRSSV